MSTPLRGECRCGRVRYLVAGDVKTVVNCHCNMCRTMNGAAFSTYAVVAESELSVSGSAFLGHYTVLDTATRHFCRHCGTPVFNTNPGRYPGAAMLYLGSLEGHEALRPGVSLYCESELAWAADPSGIPRRPRGPEQGG